MRCSVRFVHRVSFRGVVWCLKPTHSVFNILGHRSVTTRDNVWLKVGIGILMVILCILSGNRAEICLFYRIAGADCPDAPTT